MTFTQCGKVIEQHFLDTEEQIQVFTAIARTKGYETEVYQIGSSEKPSSSKADNGIKIIKITDPEKQSWNKAIMCVETKQIFPSIKECSKKYGIAYKSLYNAIRSGSPRKGLHFVLYDGECPKSVRTSLLSQNNKKYYNRYIRKVLCVTTGHIFNSVSEIFTVYPNISLKTFYYYMKRGKPVKGLQFQYI